MIPYNTSVPAIGSVYSLRLKSYNGSRVSLIADLAWCYHLMIYDATLTDPFLRYEYSFWGWGSREFRGSFGRGVAYIGANDTLEHEYTLVLFGDGNAMRFWSDCGCTANWNDRGEQLVADGRSTCTVDWCDPANPPSDGYQWAFEGDSLDCKIQGILQGKQARITAGTKNGTVTVVATHGDCRYYGKLKLCGSTCQGNGCSTVPGGGGASLSSVDFRLSMGVTAFDEHGGFIRLHAETPSADLASPSLLQPMFEGPNVEYCWTNDVLRQVVGPLGIVDVTATSAFEYALTMYPTNQITGFDGGIYSISPSATPIVTWTVRNPDTSGTNFNHLWLIETRGGVIHTNKYSYESANGEWALEDGEGLRKESTWKEVQGTTTYEYREVRQGTNLVWKERRKYEPVGERDELKELVEGDGGTARTTTYTYYGPSGEGYNTNQLKQVDYPDGRWTIFEYDSEHRVAREYSAHLDAAPTTNSTLCRVTEYAYALTQAVDGEVEGGSYLPDKARKTIVTLPGQGGAHEVSRSYRKLYSGLTMEKACPNPLSTWSTSGNLLTKTEYYTEGSDDGRVARVTRPDGTVSLYGYGQSATALTTTNKTGEINATWDALLNGTESAKAISQFGNTQTNATRQVVNEAPPSVVQSSQTYQYLDSLEQDHRVITLGGLTNELHYACCGLDTSVSPDGVTTQYEYDGLRRVIATRQVELGITVSNTLDALGRTMVKTRYGSDGTPMVLAQYAYDVLGRLTSETNALGGVTTYSETTISNKLQKTTTSPDGGTRVETYYRDGRLEKVTGTAVQPVRYDYGVEQDGGYDREYTLETKLDASGNPTFEWTKTYTDGMGRAYKTVYAAASGPYPYRQTTYNDLGQRAKERDPDGNVTLYAYNGTGELVSVVQDLDGNDLIEANGASSQDDRITNTLLDVLAVSAQENTHGCEIRRTRVYAYALNNSTVTNLISMTEESTDGLRTWRTVYPDGATPATTATETAYGGGTNRTETVTYPDGSTQVSAYTYGRLQSVTRKDANNVTLSQTTYGYDAHGRQNTMTDARNGTTTYTFNAGDQIATVTTPAPGGGGTAQVTTSYYDTQSRQIGQILPDGTATTNLYYASGLLWKTWGSRIYPVEYTYDPQGRMKTMTTWRNVLDATTAGVTTWNYDAYRGWLESKRYADNTGPDYGYTPGGRLQTRLWARGTSRLTTTTTYQGPDLVQVAYSDGTPSTSWTYDRLGCRQTTTRNGVTATMTYDNAGLLTGEAYSGGTLDGLGVTNRYDAYMRRTTNGVTSGGSYLTWSTNAYDAASRLLAVGDGAVSATYGYLANSPLVEQISFKQGATTRMTTTKQYDVLNRLTNQVSVPEGTGSGSWMSYAYRYNSANQRDRATLADASYWVYGYDALGQVVSGKRYWTDGTPVAGQQFEYGFDTIGNRASTQLGGDQTGAGLRSAAYTPNSLNQYTQRTVPGAVDVLGSVSTNAAVTVNGFAPYRRGGYFQKALSVNNTSAPQYQGVTVISTLGAASTATTGSVFLAKTPEVFTYDPDGNLVSDGRWTNRWDAENRLISMESLSSAPAGSKRRLTFDYDAQGRRILKTACVWTNEAWSLVLSNKFLYDGWNLVTELNATNNAVIRSYLWGLDVSSSLQGAGSVGGLLAVTPSGGAAELPVYDGNGNVMGLLDSTATNWVARYEYGPFGEVIRASGTMAKLSAFRFSTKYQDDETGLLYYGYRYLDTSTGRWLSRDPIGENGGLNLYEFGSNDAVDKIDVRGLTVGQFSIVWSYKVRTFQYAGWRVRLRWAPPSDWPTACAPCTKAVWVQTWSMVSYGLFEDKKVGPKKDWDESDYAGNATPWENGRWPRGHRLDESQMWDDPYVTPLYNLRFYHFSATSCVKCILGKEAGRKYGCYDWGFTFNPSRMPDLVGGVAVGPY